jgi:hypothetical protein
MDKIKVFLLILTMNMGGGKNVFENEEISFRKVIFSCSILDFFIVWFTPRKSLTDDQ